MNYYYNKFHKRCLRMPNNQAFFQYCTALAANPYRFGKNKVALALI